MIRATLLAAILFPAQAAALSCMPLNAAISLDRMMAQDQPARLAIGVTVLNDPTLPTRDGEASYRFTGRILTGTGWREIADMPVTAQITCVGYWCGGPPPAGTSLYLLEEAEAGHVLHLRPCHEQVYPEPDPAQLEALTRCLENGRCSLDDFAAFER